ncbi:helix-turn-helix domain-containing protein, partial [Saccharopolyspora elongata]|uniref:helix-turn-helix domain-containing protein n=1 Tax=Saccharopolyspora elongata TaxID=2530387 RepID=UPI00104BE97E
MFNKILAGLRAEQSAAGGPSQAPEAGSSQTQVQEQEQPLGGASVLPPVDDTLVSEALRGDTAAVVDEVVSQWGLAGQEMTVFVQGQEAEFTAADDGNPGTLEGDSDGGDGLLGGGFGGSALLHRQSESVEEPSSLGGTTAVRVEWTPQGLLDAADALDAARARDLSLSAVSALRWGSALGEVRQVFAGRDWLAEAGPAYRDAAFRIVAHVLAETPAAMYLPEFAGVDLNSVVDLLGVVAARVPAWPVRFTPEGLRTVADRLDAAESAFLEGQRRRGTDHGHVVRLQQAQAEVADVLGGLTGAHRLAGLHEVARGAVGRIVAYALAGRPFALEVLYATPQLRNLGWGSAEQLVQEIADNVRQVRQWGELAGGVEAWESFSGALDRLRLRSHRVPELASLGMVGDVRDRLTELARSAEEPSTTEFLVVRRPTGGRGQAVHVRGWEALSGVLPDALGDPGSGYWVYGLDAGGRRIDPGQVATAMPVMPGWTGAALEAQLTRVRSGEDAWLEQLRPAEQGAYGNRLGIANRLIRGEHFGYISPAAAAFREEYPGDWGNLVELAKRANAGSQPALALFRRTPELAGLVHESSSRVPLRGLMPVLTHVVRDRYQRAANEPGDQSGQERVLAWDALPAITVAGLEDAANLLVRETDSDRWDVLDAAHQLTESGRELNAEWLKRGQTAAKAFWSDGTPDTETSKTLKKLPSAKQDAVEVITAHVLAGNPLALLMLAKTEAFRAADSWGPVPQTRSAPSTAVHVMRVFATLVSAEPVVSGQEDSRGGAAEQRDVLPLSAEWLLRAVDQLRTAEQDISVRKWLDRAEQLRTAKVMVWAAYGELSDDDLSALNALGPAQLAVNRLIAEALAGVPEALQIVRDTPRLEELGWDPDVELDGVAVALSALEIVARNSSASPESAPPASMVLPVRSQGAVPAGAGRVGTRDSDGDGGAPQVLRDAPRQRLRRAVEEEGESSTGPVRRATVPDPDGDVPMGDFPTFSDDDVFGGFGAPEGSVSGDSEGVPGDKGKRVVGRGVATAQAPGSGRGESTAGAEQGHGAVQLSFKEARFAPDAKPTPAERLLATYKANPGRPIPMGTLQRVGRPERLDNPIHPDTFVHINQAVRERLGGGSFEGSSGWIVTENKRRSEISYLYVPKMPVADMRTGHRFTAVDWGKLLDADELKVLLFFVRAPGRELFRADVLSEIWDSNSGVMAGQADERISKVNRVLRRHGAGVIVSHTSGRKGGGASSWWYTTTGAPGDRLIDASVIEDLVEKVWSRKRSPRAKGLLMKTPDRWGWLERDEFDVMRALKAQPGTRLKFDVFASEWVTSRIKKQLNAVLQPGSGRVDGGHQQGMVFVPGQGGVELEEAGDSWVGGVWSRARVLSAASVLEPPGSSEAWSEIWGELSSVSGVGALQALSGEDGAVYEGLARVVRLRAGWGEAAEVVFDEILTGLVAEQAAAAAPSQEQEQEQEQTDADAPGNDGMALTRPVGSGPATADVRPLELTLGGLESLARALERREAELDVENAQRLNREGLRTGSSWKAVVDRGLVPAALSGGSKKVLQRVARHITAKTPLAVQAVRDSELAGLVNAEGESRIPLAGWLVVLAHGAEGSGSVAGGVGMPDGRLTFERLEEIARKLGDAAEVAHWALPATGEVLDETKREAAAEHLVKATLAVQEASENLQVRERLGQLKSREQEVVKTFVAHVVALNPFALRVMAKTEAFRAAESWGNTDGWLLELSHLKKSREFAETLLNLVAGALLQGTVLPGSAESQEVTDRLPAGLREVVSALNQDELSHLQSAFKAGWSSGPKRRSAGSERRSALTKAKQEVARALSPEGRRLLGGGDPVVQSAIIRFVAEASVSGSLAQKIALQAGFAATGDVKSLLEAVVSRGVDWTSLAAGSSQVQEQARADADASGNGGMASLRGPVGSGPAMADVRPLEWTPDGLKSLARALERREAVLKSSSLLLSEKDMENARGLSEASSKLGSAWTSVVGWGLVPAALSEVSEAVIKTVARHIVAKTPLAVQAVGTSELAGLVNAEGESRIPLAGWLAVLAHVAEGSGSVAGGVGTPDGRLTFERLEKVAWELGDAAEVERWALPPTGEVHDETKREAEHLVKAKLAVLEASEKEARESLGKLGWREREVVKTFVAHVLAMDPVALRVMAKTEAFHAKESWGDTEHWVPKPGSSQRFRNSRDVAATLLNLVAGALLQGTVPGGSSQILQQGSVDGQEVAQESEDPIMPAGLRAVVSAMGWDELRPSQSMLRAQVLAGDRRQSRLSEGRSALSKRRSDLAEAKQKVAGAYGELSPVDRQVLVGLDPVARGAINRFVAEASVSGSLAQKIALQTGFAAAGDVKSLLEAVVSGRVDWTSLAEAAAKELDAASESGKRSGASGVRRKRLPAAGEQVDPQRDTPAKRPRVEDAGSGSGAGIGRLVWSPERVVALVARLAAVEGFVAERTAEAVALAHGRVGPEVEGVFALLPDDVRQAVDRFVGYVLEGRRSALQVVNQTPQLWRATGSAESLLGAVAAGLAWGALEGGSAAWDGFARALARRGASFDGEVMPRSLKVIPEDRNVREVLDETVMHATEDRVAAEALVVRWPEGGLGGAAGIRAWHVPAVGELPPGLSDAGFRYSVFVVDNQGQQLELVVDDARGVLNRFADMNQLEESRPWHYDAALAAISRLLEIGEFSAAYIDGAARMIARGLGVLRPDLVMPSDAPPAVDRGAGQDPLTSAREIYVAASSLRPHYNHLKAAQGIVSETNLFDTPVDPDFVDLDGGSPYNMLSRLVAERIANSDWGEKRLREFAVGLGHHLGTVNPAWWVQFEGLGGSGPDQVGQETPAEPVQYDPEELRDWEKQQLSGGGHDSAGAGPSTQPPPRHTAPDYVVGSRPGLERELQDVVRVVQDRFKIQIGTLRGVSGWDEVAQRLQASDSVRAVGVLFDSSNGAAWGLERGQTELRAWRGGHKQPLSEVAEVAEGTLHLFVIDGNYKVLHGTTVPVTYLSVPSEELKRGDVWGGAAAVDSFTEATGLDPEVQPFPNKAPALFRSLWELAETADSFDALVLREVGDGGVSAAWHLTRQAVLAGETPPEFGSETLNEQVRYFVYVAADGMRIAHDVVIDPAKAPAVLSRDVLDTRIDGGRLAAEGFEAATGKSLELRLLGGDPREARARLRAAAVVADLAGVVVATAPVAGTAWVLTREQVTREEFGPEFSRSGVDYYAHAVDSAGETIDLDLDQLSRTAQAEYAPLTWTSEGMRQAAQHLPMLGESRDDDQRHSEIRSKVEHAHSALRAESRAFLAALDEPDRDAITAIVTAVLYGTKAAATMLVATPELSNSSWRSATSLLDAFATHLRTNRPAGFGEIAPRLTVAPSTTGAALVGEESADTALPITGRQLVENVDGWSEAREAFRGALGARGLQGVAPAPAPVLVEGDVQGRLESFAEGDVFAQALVVRLPRSGGRGQAWRVTVVEVRMWVEFDDFPDGFADGFSDYYVYAVDDQGRVVFGGSSGVGPEESVGSGVGDGVESGVHPDFAVDGMATEQASVGLKDQRDESLSGDELGNRSPDGLSTVQEQEFPGLPDGSWPEVEAAALAGRESADAAASPGPLAVDGVISGRVLVEDVVGGREARRDFQDALRKRRIEVVEPEPIQFSSDAGDARVFLDDLANGDAGEHGYRGETFAEAVVVRLPKSGGSGKVGRAWHVTGTNVKLLEFPEDFADSSSDYFLYAVDYLGETVIGGSTGIPPVEESVGTGDDDHTTEQPDESLSGDEPGNRSPDGLTSTLEGLRQAALDPDAAAPAGQESADVAAPPVPVAVDGVISGRWLVENVEGREALEAFQGALGARGLQGVEPERVLLRSVAGDVRGRLESLVEGVGGFVEALVVRLPRSGGAGQAWRVTDVDVSGWELWGPEGFADGFSDYYVYAVDDQGRVVFGGSSSVGPEESVGSGVGDGVESGVHHPGFPADGMVTERARRIRRLRRSWHRGYDRVLRLFRRIRHGSPLAWSQGIVPEDELVRDGDDVASGPTLPWETLDDLPDVIDNETLARLIPGGEKASSDFLSATQISPVEPRRYVHDVLVAGSTLLAMADFGVPFAHAVVVKVWPTGEESGLAAQAWYVTGQEFASGGFPAGFDSGPDDRYFIFAADAQLEAIPHDVVTDGLTSTLEGLRQAALDPGAVMELLVRSQGIVPEDELVRDGDDVASGPTLPWETLDDLPDVIDNETLARLIPGGEKASSDFLSATQISPVEPRRYVHDVLVAGSTLLAMADFGVPFAHAVVVKVWPTGEESGLAAQAWYVTKEELVSRGFPAGFDSGPGHYYMFAADAQLEAIPHDVVINPYKVPRAADVPDGQSPRPQTPSQQHEEQQADSDSVDGLTWTLDDLAAAAKRLRNAEIERLSPQERASAESRLEQAMKQVENASASPTLTRQQKIFLIGLEPHPEPGRDGRDDEAPEYVEAIRTIIALALIGSPATTEAFARTAALKFAEPQADVLLEIFVQQLLDHRPGSSVSAAPEPGSETARQSDEVSLPPVEPLTEWPALESLGARGRFSDNDGSSVAFDDTAAGDRMIEHEDPGQESRADAAGVAGGEVITRQQLRDNVVDGPKARENFQQALTNKGLPDAEPEPAFFSDDANIAKALLAALANAGAFVEAVVVRLPKTGASELDGQAWHLSVEQVRHSKFPDNFEDSDSRYFLYAVGDDGSAVTGDFPIRSLEGDPGAGSSSGPRVGGPRPEEATGEAGGSSASRVPDGWVGARDNSLDNDGTPMEVDEAAPTEVLVEPDSGSMSAQDAEWVRRMFAGLERRAADAFARGEVSDHPTRGPRLFGNTRIRSVPLALDVDLMELPLRQVWGLLKRADMIRSELPDEPFTPEALDEAGRDVVILESNWTAADRQILQELPEQFRTGFRLPAKREIAMARSAIWLGGPLDGSPRTAKFIDGLAATRRNFKGPMVLFTDVPRADITQALNGLALRGDRLDSVRRMVLIAGQLGMWVVNIDELPLAKVSAPVVERVLMDRTKSSPYGYVQASDALRWLLSFALGNLYLDGDAVLDRPQVFQQVLVSDVGYRLLERQDVEREDTGGFVSNDAILMSRGHPKALGYLGTYARAGELTQIDLFGDRLYNRPAELFDENPKGIFFLDHSSVMDRTGPGLLANVRRNTGKFHLLPGVSGSNASSWLAAVVPSAEPKIAQEDHARSEELVAKVADVLILYLYNRPHDMFYPAVRNLLSRHENPQLVLQAASTFIASVPAFRSRAASVTNAEFRNREWQHVATTATLEELFTVTGGDALTWRGYLSGPAQLKRPPAELLPEGLITAGGWRNALTPVASVQENSLMASLVRWRVAGEAGHWWNYGIPGMGTALLTHLDVHWRMHWAQMKIELDFTDARDIIESVDFEWVPGGVDTLILMFSGKTHVTAVVAGKKDGEWSRAWNVVSSPQNGRPVLVDALVDMANLADGTPILGELHPTLSEYDELYASAVNVDGTPLTVANAGGQADANAGRPRWDRNLALGMAAHLKSLESRTGADTDARRAAQADRLRAAYQRFDKRPADDDQVLAATRRLLSGFGLEEAVEVITLHAWRGAEAVRRLLPSDLPSDLNEFVPVVAKIIALDVAGSMESPPLDHLREDASAEEIKLTVRRRVGQYLTSLYEAAAGFTNLDDITDEQVREDRTRQLEHARRAVALIDGAALRERGLTAEQLALIVAQDLDPLDEVSSANTVARKIAGRLGIAIAEPGNQPAHVVSANVPAGAVPAGGAVGLNRPGGGWTAEGVVSRASWMWMGWPYSGDAVHSEPSRRIKDTVKKLVQDAAPGVLGGREFIDGSLGKAAVVLAAHELWDPSRRSRGWEVAVSDAADLIREIITDLAGVPNPREVSLESFESRDEAHAWVDINAEHMRQIGSLLHIPGALWRHPDYDMLCVYAWGALYNSMKTGEPFRFDPTGDLSRRLLLSDVARELGVGDFTEYDGGRNSLIDVGRELPERGVGVAMWTVNGNQYHLVGVWRNSRGQVWVLDASTGLPAALPGGTYYFGVVDASKLDGGLIRLPGLKPGSDDGRDAQRRITEIVEPGLRRDRMSAYPAVDRATLEEFAQGDGAIGEFRADTGRDPRPRVIAASDDVWGVFTRLARQPNVDRVFLLEGTRGGLRTWRLTGDDLRTRNVPDGLGSDDAVYFVDVADVDGNLIEVGSKPKAALVEESAGVVRELGRLTDLMYFVDDVRGARRAVAERFGGAWELARVVSELLPSSNEPGSDVVVHRQLRRLGDVVRFLDASTSGALVGYVGGIDAAVKVTGAAPETVFGWVRGGVPETGDAGRLRLAALEKVVKTFGGSANIQRVDQRLADLTTQQRRQFDLPGDVARFSDVLAVFARTPASDRVRFVDDLARVLGLVESSSGEQRGGFVGGRERTERLERTNAPAEAGGGWVGARDESLDDDGSLAEGDWAGVGDPVDVLMGELDPFAENEQNASSVRLTPEVLRDAADRLRAAEPPRPPRTDADKQVSAALREASKEVTDIGALRELAHSGNVFRAKYPRTWESVRLVVVHAAAGTDAALQLLTEWGLEFEGQRRSRDDVATLLADLMRRMREFPPGPEDKLTKDQRRLVPYLAEGMSEAQIADRLRWSGSRFDDELEGLRKDLGLESRAQVVKWAYDQRSSAGSGRLDFTSESLRRARIMLLAAEPRPARSEAERQILDDLNKASKAVKDAYDGREPARRVDEGTWADISVLARHALAGTPEALELINGSELAHLVVSTVFEDHTVKGRIAVSAAGLVDQVVRRAQAEADSGGSGDNAGEVKGKGKGRGSEEILGVALAAEFRAHPNVLWGWEKWLGEVRDAVEKDGVKSRASSEKSFGSYLSIARKILGSGSGSGSGAAGWVVATSGKYMFIPDAAVSDAAVADGERSAGDRKRLNWGTVLEERGVKLLAEFAKRPRRFIPTAEVGGQYSGKTLMQRVSQINGLLRANSAGHIFGVNDDVRGKGFIYTSGEEGDRLLSRDEIPDADRKQLHPKRRRYGWELLVGDKWRVWLSDDAGKLLSALQKGVPRRVDDSSKQALDELYLVGVDTGVGNLVVASVGGNLELEQAGHAATLTKLDDPELGEMNYRGQQEARNKRGLEAPEGSRSVKRQRRAAESPVRLESFNRVLFAPDATPDERLEAFYRANQSRPIPRRILLEGARLTDKMFNPQNAVVQKRLDGEGIDAGGWIVAEQRGDENAFLFVPKMSVDDIRGRTGHRFTAVDWGKLLTPRLLEMLHLFAQERGQEVSRTKLRESFWGQNSDDETERAVDERIRDLNKVLRLHGAGIIVSHGSSKKGGGARSLRYTTTGAEGDRLVDPSTIEDLMTRVRPRGDSPRAAGLLMKTSGWWGWLMRDEFDVMRELMAAQRGTLVKPDVFEKPWGKLRLKRLERIRDQLNAVLKARPDPEVPGGESVGSGRVEFDRKEGMRFVPGEGVVELEEAGDSWV